MKKLLPLILLALLPSCGTFGDISRAAASARDMIGHIQKSYEQLKPSIDTAVSTATRLVDEGQRIYDKSAEMVESMKQTAAELKEMERQAYAEADEDGDGDLNLKERLAYWALLAGGGFEVSRRKLKQTQQQFAELTGKIDHERAKRKAAEAS